MDTQNEKQAYVPQQQQEEPSIDIKQLIYIFLNNWFLFAGFVFVALVAAFLINRYTTKIYQTNGTVLIKEGRSNYDATAIMTSMAYGNFQNIDNEIAILKSYSLSDRVVRKMNIEVTYMSKGRIQKVEQYKTAPYIVEIDRSKPQAVGLAYNISFLDNGKICLKAKADGYSKYDYVLGTSSPYVRNEVDFEGEYQQGEWIDNGYNRIRIVLKDKENPEEEMESKVNEKEKDNKSNMKLSFWLNSYPSLVRQMSGFSVSNISKQASVASIVMSGTDKRKIVDFINTLMAEYVSRGLEKKNLVSENTIEFIDTELSTITESLKDAEGELKNFRTTNDLMNLDLQSSQLYSNIQSLTRERAEMAVNVKIYKRLQDYIQVQIDDPENLAAPSTMGINDPLLNRLVNELVTLSQTKATQLLTQTEYHPQIVKLDEQIVTAKKTILETVNNLVLNAEMSLGEIERRIAKAESESRMLPAKQQELITYQRNFDFNDETYKYLMRRRAEAQILRASNTPDNEILDEARLERTVLTKPRAKMNYLIALIIGFLIPALYLFLKDFFNVTVNNRKDVEKLTKFPIIGQVAKTDSKNPLVVVNSPKAPISESFRSIRTNIEYLTQGKSQSTILVTGDTQGIGKTFNAVNIACIYALYGKKTILLGFDLRKPKIYQDFGLTNNVGISSYLSNKDTLDNVIQTSSALPSLDIISAGPIPPNPAELIASDKCAELFEELKKRYDYIIIDTPPLGLVTDAFLLMRHTDVNLFIVRQDVTNKNIFSSVIKDLEDRGIKVSIIINGIETGKSYGYGKYRYGYGYTYGYGYAYGYGYGHYGQYGYGYYGEDESGKKKRHHHHHHSEKKDKE